MGVIKLLNAILSHCNSPSQVLVLFYIFIYVLYRLLADKSDFLLRMISLFVIVFLMQAVIYSVCNVYEIKRIGILFISCFSAAVWGIILAKRDGGFWAFVFLIVSALLFPFKILG